jgi:hypothetical protein
LRQQSAASRQPAQQIQRQRQHLERDEHGEQIVGSREQQHAREREQREGEHLGLTHARAVGGMLGRAVRDRGRLRRERVEPAGMRM